MGGMYRDALPTGSSADALAGRSAGFDPHGESAPVGDTDFGLFFPLVRRKCPELRLGSFQSRASACDCIMYREIHTWLDNSLVRVQPRTPNLR